ncbi:MAG: hypothetical protein B6D78_05430 [gamma proteobacterium symbiont of Ctena orbiculata]|nr:MAG: hypothetical protein B6D78_05430 [gamma proteobacterium symbiont of Ctena orbiculata]PVV27321.1 MAG: hypothetical protein B6D79_03040 [gamma proteobacterium symbiont of Ctena orbiculata]
MAKQLYSKGHQVLLHGPNPLKLEAAEKAILALQGNSPHRTTTHLMQGNPHRWYVLSRRS